MFSDELLCYGEGISKQDLDEVEEKINNQVLCNYYVCIMYVLN